MNEEDATEDQIEGVGPLTDNNDAGREMSNFICTNIEQLWALTSVLKTNVLDEIKLSPTAGGNSDSESEDEDDRPQPNLNEEAPSDSGDSELGSRDLT